jgi:hypothetical protein
MTSEALLGGYGESDTFQPEEKLCKYIFRRRETVEATADTLRSSCTCHLIGTDDRVSLLIRPSLVFHEK